jgi:tRNA-modifying protein YgfZ
MKDMSTHIYNASLEDAVWRDMNHWGRFAVRGADAAALLHHLTTNDIKGLKNDDNCDAALISSKARMLDLVTIWKTGDGFRVLTSPNRREFFKPHAQKFILFRQDIQIEDVTESTALFGIFGPNAKRVLESPNDGAQVSATERLPGGGFFLWDNNRETLQKLISNSSAPLCDNETFNIRRIEAGIPVTGLELTEDVNPWEANLGRAISLHKGCYNGQEIVARLNTYKKVKQQLRGLKLELPLNITPGEKAPLKCNDRDAGFATSSVVSPRFGPIALAYVRGDFVEVGTQLQVENQTATVVELPFS